MTFGERLQDEAFPPESVNANKDDRKAAVKVPDTTFERNIQKSKTVPDTNCKMRSSRSTQKVHKIISTRLLKVLTKRVLC